VEFIESLINSFLQVGRRSTPCRQDKCRCCLLYLNLATAPNPLETDFPRPNSSGISKFVVNSPQIPVTFSSFSWQISSVTPTTSSLICSLAT